MKTVKTAVSLPNSLFKEAEALAHGLHLSRSALFALAIQEIIKKHQQGLLTKQLDDFYEGFEHSNDDSDLINTMDHKFLTGTQW